MYFAYRDARGNYLDNTTVSERVIMNFKFSYDTETFFNRSKYTCAYINVDSDYWINSTCLHEEDVVNGFYNCSCSHMSFYSVIEDNFDIDVRIIINL